MYRRSKDLLFMFLIIDLIILNTIIFLGSLVHPIVADKDFSSIYIYYIQANLSWIITIFIFSKNFIYLREGFINRVWNTTQRFVFYIMISTTVVFFVFPHDYSRVFLIHYSLIFYFSLIVYYLVIYKFLQHRRKNGFYVSRLLIVGFNKTSKKVKDLVEKNYVLGYQFMGFASNSKSGDKQIIVNTSEIERIIKEFKIDMVFVTINKENRENRTNQLINICRKSGVRMRIIPELQQLDYIRMEYDRLDNLIMIDPLEMPLDHVHSRFIKRQFDLLFSIFVIVFIFSWLYPIIAFLIKISSKGPVLFVQERTGVNNKTFKCYKFRTMKVNDEADTRQATASDDRITPIGKFLRRSNIDELPQFFNVFLGTMSVVGPRPHMLKHTDQYSNNMNDYLIRHYVKPGVTGWAQVNGYRGETNELWKMEKRVQYDKLYIRKWSLWLDLEIIFKTVFDKKTFFNAG